MPLSENKFGQERKDARVLGVILARGGSKGVPGKNIRPLLGIPLIAYTICEAKRSQKLTRLIVSTDSGEIRKISLAYGAEVPFLRPAHLSTDTATSLDGVKHALAWVEHEENQVYDYVVELLCTNPMKTSEDIDAVVNKLIATGADSVIGVSKLDDLHPVRIKKIVDDKIEDFCCQREIPGSHRQQLKPDAYVRNGSMYACRRDCLDRRVGSSESRPYVMPSERSVNIDSENDFLLAEILMKKYPRPYIQPIPTQTRTMDFFNTAVTSSVISHTMEQRRVLITTVPFGDYPDSPIELFKSRNIDFTINPLGRPPSEEELIRMIPEYGILLAGTSPITRRVMEQAPYLKLITRAGVGIDNVDLQAAAELGIQVTYTPQAPAPAVAEFTVGLMLSLLRHIHSANQDVHQGIWKRRVGMRLAERTVGLLGVGTIGGMVIKNIQGFCPRILACDINPQRNFSQEFDVEWVDRENLFKEADLISIHLPLLPSTRNSISDQEFQTMKPQTLLVNTSRGGIIDEEALYRALSQKQIAGAALDVFSKEPYAGPLSKLENCLLTAHMAAASVDCKKAMETQATWEIIRFLSGHPVEVPVPREIWR